MLGNTVQNSGLFFPGAIVLHLILLSNQQKSKKKRHESENFWFMPFFF